MIMAKLFQELKRHNKFPFSVQFLCMDPGYNEYNRKIIEENAKLLGIPLHFFESDIFESVFEIRVLSLLRLCKNEERPPIFEGKGTGL